MAFPPGFLDELRNRVSLAGLVGRRVRLVRRGREYAGLCPFHNEKTPSFYVVEDKGFFHCFGCGAHGDAIGFTMRIDNVDFIEAIEKLSAEAGLRVPKQSAGDRERAQRQKTIFEALEAAAEFYRERLWSGAGARARAYLAERGLDEATIRSFRLGWAGDDRRALRRALAAAYPESLLVKAGLLRASESGGDPHDYFRERVMFPIGDRAGRVIAFGGRTLADAQPKYLNSPEHPLFEKGRVLYGWATARAAIGREPATPAIVVEGYMDVIALHRAAFAGAVAPLGTALTEAQLQELWRLAAEPVLCFDGDAAGQRAATRALRRALPLLRPGYSLRFAVLPGGEDPDSLIRHDGRAAFDEILGAARPLSALLWETELGSRPADTPERRADLRRRLDEDLALIADPTVRGEYRAFLLDRFYSTMRTARLGRGAGRQALKRAAPNSAIEDRWLPRTTQGHRQRELLLRIVLHFPALIDAVEEELATLEMPEPELDRLRREILNAQALRPGLDAEGLQQHLVLNGFAPTVDALLAPSVDSGFLGRRAEAASVRSDWDHVLRMLMGGDRSSVAEAGSDLIHNVSAESWARFLAAREHALHPGDPADGQG
ncbi:MAG: DNA primase [Alphaproteobacteria bacterium]|nr:DNA primase [Alphaproteobacteria bacterium]